MQVLELSSKDYDGTKANIVDGFIDPAFRKIRKNSIGFHIWQVENNRAEALPRDKFGIFYDNCTYIIYAAATKGSYANQYTLSREIKPNTVQLNNYIHFWLGSKATPDKSGNVAYKVIELDNYLDNVSSQYRETQEHESARFMSYFKNGIIVYSPEERSSTSVGKLFHVKDKKCPRCIQRTPINWSHFRSNFVMVLQTTKYIFIWIGRTSSHTERLNAFHLALKFRTHSKSMPEIVTVDDGYEQSMSETKKKVWNEYLSLSQRSVLPLDVTVTASVPTLRLYRGGFQNGIYRFEELKSSAIQQRDLSDNKHAYIIDSGETYGVFIWVGRHASVKEKAEAMRNARGFVKKKAYPFATPVTRIVEDYEPLEFIRLFPMWNESDQNGNKTVNLLGKFDAGTLMHRTHLAAESQLIDDGTGDLTIYRVNSNGDIVEIPKRKNVALFSGDCYLIHYIVTFPDNNLKSNGYTGVKHILYLWTGKQCAPEVAKQGEELADEFGLHLRRSVMEVRVAENFEPPHFLQIFKGHLIVFKGKCIDFDPNGSCCVYPNTYLLKVLGNATYNSKAIQISSKTTEFTSKDCFLLRTADTNIWIWCGPGSTGDNREMAKLIGSLIGEYNLVIGSNEPIEFWHFIPDSVKLKLKNANSSRNCLINPDVNLIESNFYIDRARAELYVCSIEANGQINSKQIVGFTQEDLSPEDIYLLDARLFIYLWVGTLSPKNEKAKCWEIIDHFLLNYPIARNLNTPRAVIYQGLEPVSFTGHFDKWETKLWDSHLTYDMERLNMEASMGNHSPIAVQRMHKNSDGDNEFDRYPKYPVDLLRSEASRLPDTIDPKMKELYLTHDDFVSLFQMDYMEFAELPNWKKQELKKSRKLF